MGRRDARPGSRRMIGAGAGRYVTVTRTAAPDRTPTPTATAHRVVPPRPTAPRRQVLVGFDGSAAGLLAVERAAQEADWRGWPLRILHARDPAHGAGPPGADALLAGAANRVRALAARTPVSTALVAGAPVSELVAASRSAGLVAVGTCAPGDPVELLAGSVAARVAAEAGAPVLIVPIPHRPASAEPPGRPVVVGVDGSPAGNAAFAFAVAEARLRGVGILAVYAATDLAGSDPLHAGALAGFDSLCMGVPVSRHRIAGDPRRVLVGLSAGAGAVVVGTRGTDGSDPPPIGAVARALIRHAASPLFIVHETDAG